nr:hypothetical protein BaRGS_030855 [Batillaria attramentaria]
MVVMKLAQWLMGRATIPSLHARRVLVTGCDTGFGRRLVLRLDKMGCHVFAACLTSEAGQELRKLTSERTTPLLMDVTKDEDVESALEQVKRALPENTGVWGVVNNAGIVGPSGMTEWLTRNDFLTPLQVNLLGMTQVTRAFLPLVRAARGRVVNTCSVLGRVAAGPAPYVASKYAAIGFTDCLRRELYHQGVSVHSIEPGAYATNITDSRLQRQSFQRTLAAAPSHVQIYYGASYVDKLMVTVDIMNRYFTGANLEEVVDAYVHALTSRRPLTRYVVGWNGQMAQQVPAVTM